MRKWSFQFLDISWKFLSNFLGNILPFSWNKRKQTFTNFAVSSVRYHKMRPRKARFKDKTSIVSSSKFWTCKLHHFPAGGAAEMCFEWHIFPKNFIYKLTKHIVWVFVRKVSSKAIELDEIRGNSPPSGSKICKILSFFTLFVQITLYRTSTSAKNRLFGKVSWKAIECEKISQTSLPFGDENRKISSFLTFIFVNILL